jgi:CheY-like chemotaxis protein
VHRVEARQEGYDIIFIDITMPILDGFGATRQIRAIEEKRKKSAMESIGLGGRDLGVDGATV